MDYLGPEMPRRPRRLVQAMSICSAINTFLNYQAPSACYLSSIDAQRTSHSVAVSVSGLEVRCTVKTSR
jgi:hypothetical protein